jgi:hypothetical protein
MTDKGLSVGPNLVGKQLQGQIIGVSRPPKFVARGGRPNLLSEELRCRLSNHVI